MAYEIERRRSLKKLHSLVSKDDLLNLKARKQRNKLHTSERRESNLDNTLHSGRGNLDNTLHSLHTLNSLHSGRIPSNGRLSGINSSKGRPPSQQSFHGDEGFPSKAMTSSQQRNADWNRNSKNEINSNALIVQQQKLLNNNSNESLVNTQSIVTSGAIKSGQMISYKASNKIKSKHKPPIENIFVDNSNVDNVLKEPIVAKAFRKEFERKPQKHDPIHSNPLLSSVLLQDTTTNNQAAPPPGTLRRSVVSKINDIIPTSSSVSLRSRRHQSSENLQKSNNTENPSRTTSRRSSLARRISTETGNGSLSNRHSNESQQNIQTLRNESVYSKRQSGKESLQNNLTRSNESLYSTRRSIKESLQNNQTKTNELLYSSRHSSEESLHMNRRRSIGSSLHRNRHSSNELLRRDSSGSLSKLNESFHSIGSRLKPLGRRSSNESVKISRRPSNESGQYSRRTSNESGQNSSRRSSESSNESKKSYQGSRSNYQSNDNGKRNNGRPGLATIFSERFEIQKGDIDENSHDSNITNDTKKSKRKGKFKNKFVLDFPKRNLRRNVVQNEPNLDHFAMLDPWLEHCRDDIALEKRATARTGRSGNSSKNTPYYDPFQCIETFELEEENMNIEENQAKLKQPVTNSAPIPCAVEHMKYLCREFSRYYFNIIRKSSANQRKVKKEDDLSKLGEIISSSRNIPQCRSFPNHLLKIVLLLPGNDKCCDCGFTSQSSQIINGNGNGNKRLEWGSTTYGTLLCQECAFRHITKSQEKNMKDVDAVLSLKDGNWSLPNILSMLEGGNKALITFVEENAATKKQRRSSAIEMPRQGRRGSLLQSTVPNGERMSRGVSSFENEDKDKDEFRSDFERVYSSKLATSYRKALHQRTLESLLRIAIHI